jgi:rRNA-processing protein FCF1
MDRVRQLDEATERAKESTRELHELLRDVKHWVKQARELHILLTAEFDRQVEEHVRVLLQTIVKEHVDTLGNETKKAMEDAVERVGKRFDHLAMLYLEGEGDESLESLAQKKKLREQYMRRTDGNY